MNQILNFIASHIFSTKVILLLTTRYFAILQRLSILISRFLYDIECRKSNIKEYHLLITFYRSFITFFITLCDCSHLLYGWAIFNIKRIEYLYGSVWCNAGYYCSHMRIGIIILNCHFKIFRIACFFEFFLEYHISFYCFHKNEFFFGISI